jgi:hypothetical protein
LAKQVRNVREHVNGAKLIRASDAEHSKKTVSGSEKASLACLMSKGEGGQSTTIRFYAMFDGPCLEDEAHPA